MNKKGISAVIATILLLLVAVFAAIGFQTWFYDFSSGTFANVERQGSDSISNVGVETIIGSILYVQAGDNLTISKVTLDGFDCSINGSYSGMESLDLSNCINQTTTSTPEIVLITDKGIFSKYTYLRGAGISSGASSSAQLISPECYTAPINTVGTWEGCDGMLIVDRDMLINANWFLPNKTDRYITFDNINYTFGDSDYNVFTGQVTDMSGDSISWASLLFADDWNDFGDPSVGFNADINYWDVSNVVDMNYMFAVVHLFDYSLNDWDTSNVENMSWMFYYSNFDNDIGNWDTSSVTDMTYMFYYNFYFDNDIGNWNTGNVENMSHMFDSTVFNQYIGDWDTNNVVDMSWMFFENLYFNQDIGNWDVSSVTNMENIFHLAESFNGNISDWDVSSVTNMFGMFDSTAFNQNISGWNTSSVTTMRWMFFDTPFNYDISGWDVSSVTHMGNMFTGATNFNQDIGGWDVSSVTNMFGMFSNAHSFNQSLSGWCVTNIPGPPTSFDTNTHAWVPKAGRQPVWGTCP